MIYLCIQSEHLFELKTECFALTCLHIPYEETCITFAHFLHLSFLLVTFAKRLFWHRLHLGELDQECTSMKEITVLKKGNILMKET